MGRCGFVKSAALWRRTSRGSRGNGSPVASEVLNTPFTESPSSREQTRRRRTMNTATVIGILVALVIVAGVIWYVTDRKRRTESLQARYGPEYTRTVSEIGSRRRAEEELVKRQERVEHLEIRPLLADQRELFAERWRGAQAAFVDDPAGAVTLADALVEEVMKTRGYPVADFEQRASDLSVHHSR